MQPASDSRPAVLTPLHRQLLLLTLLLAVCAAIYFPGLQGPMLLDDFPQLSGLMSSAGQGWQALAGNYLFSSSGPFSRPVSMVTFIANAVLSGDDLRYWKAVNLLLHLLTAVSVFFLARLLLHVTTPAAGMARAGWLALLVSGLWLLHALHVSTVLYIVQRMAQLSALFVFTGLLAYGSGRVRQLDGRPDGGWLIALAWLVCLPLAVLSKENGVLLALLIPLLELVVFRPRADYGRAGRYLLPAMLLPLVVASAYLLLHFDAYVLDGYVAREFTMSQRLLTESRVLVMYLGQLLLPLPGLTGFYHDDITVSRGLLEPPGTLGALLLLAGLLALAWRMRARQPLVTLGILFFFVAHALESTILPLELMFEHRNYLAAFGVLLVVVVALSQLFRQPRLLAATGVVLLLFAASLTLVRAQLWGSPALLMQHMYAVHPDSRRLVIIQANRHAEAGDYARALELLGRFDEPGFRINRLYVGCLRDGRIGDGELQAVTAGMAGIVNDQVLTGLIQLANLGLDGRCGFSGRGFLALLDRAAAASIRALPLQKLHMYRAHYLHRLDGVDAALPALEAAFAAVQDNPVPLFLATEWLLDAGQAGRAQAVYARALAVAAASGRDYTDFTVPIGARF